MNSGNPVLSVITPVFNGIRFIEFCIRNVIDQKCSPAEHIIIDGGSTDGTVDVIRKYAQEYRHIRWVSEPDRGQSDAMNKGIAKASGQIVSFLNVDDYYESGALCEVLPMFKGLREPSLLVGNCNVWGGDGKLLSVCKPFKIGLLELLRGNYSDAFPLNPSAYFYHKSLHQRIGPYKVDENFGMDVHFVFQAVQKANVVYVDRLWGNYRYLEDTKTFRDVENGMNSIRVRNITEYYRRQQPFHIRGYLSLLEAKSRLRQRATHLLSIFRKA